MKLFQPHPDLKEQEQLSSLLKIWVQSVLEEYELNTEDIRASTTDGGSDVRRCCTQLIGEHWVWCIAHLMNRALVDALGMNVTSKSNEDDEEGSRCKNKSMRSLLKKFKKVLSFLHQASGSANGGIL